MANEEIMLGVRLDVSKASSAWEQFVKQLVYGLNTFTELQGKLNGSTVSLQANTVALQGNVETLKAGKTSIDGNIASLQTQNTAIKGNTSTINANTASLQGNINNLKAGKTSIDGNIASLQTQNTAIKGNTGSILSANTAIDGNISKMNSQKTSIQGNIEAINTQSVVINNYIKEARKAESANEDLGMSFSKLILGATIGTVIGNLFSEGLQVAGRAIKDFINTASNEFLKLDRTIRLIRGLTQDLGEDFNSLDKKISKSALTVGALYSNTASGLQTLLASGITNNSTDALKMYEDIATASKLSVSQNKTEQEALREGIDSTIVTLKNFDLTSKDVPTVLNQIAVAAAKSRLDIGDFGKEVGSISSEFAGLKVPFNEAISLFSIFSNKLSSAQEASVALRALARNIATPDTDMKKFEQEAKAKGINFLFGPTAVQQAGGLNEYLNQMLDTIQKFDKPVDKLKELFSEARAGKGLQQALLAFQTDRTGLTEFEKFNQEVVNNTKFLQNQVAELQQSLDERMNVAKNKFTNVFTGIFKEFKVELVDTMEALAGGLNNIINISSDFYQSFDDDNGGNSLREGLRLVGSLLVLIGQAVAFDIEAILKLIGVFVQFADLITSILAESLKTGMNLITTFGNYIWQGLFGTKSQKEQASQELKNFITKSLDESGSIIQNKLKGFGESFENLFDTSKYSSLGGGKNPVNSDTKNIAEGEKKEYRSQALLVGESLISNLDEVITKTQQDISKLTLNEFDYARQKIAKDYDKTLSEISSNLRSIRENNTAEIAQIDQTLLDPDLTDDKRATLISNKEKLAKQILTIEQRTNQDLAILAQKRNLEIESINKKQAEKEKQEQEKRVKEYIQAVNKQYDARMNLIKAQENWDKLAVKLMRGDEVDLINVENDSLKKQIALLTEKKSKFSSQENKAGIDKEISERQLKLQENKLKSEDLLFQKREFNLNKNLDNESKRLDFLAEKYKYTDEQILNNQVFYNSKKIKTLNDFLYAESKLMTARQKQQYQDQIAELNMTIELDKVKMNMLNVQKRQEANKFSNEQGNTQSAKNYQDEVDSIKNIQTETQFLYDSKKIGLSELQRVTKEVNESLIQIEEGRINTLNKNEEGYGEKVKEIQSKIRELKNTNARLDIQISEDARKKETDRLIELQNTSSSIINSVKNLSSVLKDDLAKSIISTFSNFDVSYQKINKILDQAPKLQEVLDLLSSKQTEIDSFSGPDLLNNPDLENLYKDKNNLEGQAQAITNSINYQAVTQAVDVIVEKLTKLFDIQEKTSNSTAHLNRTLKDFGANSQQAKDSAQGLNEQFIEMARVIPGIGDLIASMARKFTDWAGITKSEEEKNKEKALFDLKYQYQEELLNKANQTFDDKIALVDLEYNKQKELLDKELISEDEYNEKSKLLTLEISNKKLKIQQDYYNSIRDLQEQAYLLDLQMSNTYDKDLQTKLASINSKYANLVIGKSQEEISLLMQNQYKEEELAQREFSQKLQSDNRNIDYEYNKVIIEKNYSELESKLQLIELEKNKLFQDLEADRNRGLINESQYQAKRSTILINSELKIRDVYKENAEKIRSLNEKSYNSELSIIEKLYTEKRKKLESEVEKELSIIKSKNDRLKALEDERTLDQEAKDKRYQKFTQMLASEKNSLGADFYRYNELNFEVGNGLDSGNEVQRKKILQDFSLGLISLEERNQAIQKLSIQKYLYYQDLLEKYQDPEKRKSITDLMDQAQMEFYEYAFDKEKEKIDLETEQAQKRLETKKKELETATSLEKSEIAKLDQAYKDSANRFKDSFVNATKDWLDYLRTNFNDLSFSQIEALSKGSTTLQENKDKSNELLGTTPTYPSVQVAQSNSTSSKWVPFSDMKAGETPAQYTDRIKAEDAAAEKARLAGLTNTKKPASSTIVSTGKPSGSMTDQEYKDYLINLLFQNGQSYDMSYYDKKYGGLSNPALENTAIERGIDPSLFKAYKSNQSAVTNNNSTSATKSITLQTNIYADTSTMFSIKSVVSDALSGVVNKINNSK